MTRELIPAFINQRAGNADAARRALRVVGGFDIREVQPHELAARIQEAARTNVRRVVVAGGDGSIGAAAGALTGCDTELAIVPSGTLNHLAKDLALPLDLAHAARLARDGNAAPVDAASVNDHVFLNTSSVGAYVTFVRLRERLEHRIGYYAASLTAAMRLLIRLPLSRVTIVADGAEREYLTPLVFVGVGERELKLPHLGARVAGGRPGLHLMIVRHRSGARTLALALAAATRGIHEVSRTPAMDVVFADSFRIDAHSRVAAVDGELVALGTTLHYRHVPGCLRIVAS